MQTTDRRRIHPSELYQPRYFRLAPEYRRCAIYVFVGAVLIMALAPFLSAFIQKGGREREASQPYVVCAFFSLLASVTGLLAFRYSIRVDWRGVATRLIWGWDLWPWEAFQDGRIRQGPSSYAYVWPKRPWWKRSLSFALLKETDQEFLRELCLSVWVPPPEPEAPVELSIRYQFGKTVRFFSGGICLGAKGYDPDYGWSAVTELRIVRLEHGRRDFERLEIALPDRTIRLFLREGSPNWQGADAESIVGLLRRYVALERTLVVAKHGPPQSIKEADYRLEGVKKRRRENRNARRLMIALILGFLLFGVAAGLYGNSWKPFPAAVIGGLLILVCWPLFRRSNQSLTREQETVEKWRSEQMAGDEP